MQLPFPDGAFDAVVCQFGVMFFPDKARALSEAHRVLRPGGVLIFNVWDRIEENEFADDRDRGPRPAVSRGSTPLPRAHAPRLSRAGADRAGSRRRRLRRAARDRHPGGAQPGPVPPGSGDCLLPGDAAAERDRGARRVAARGSDRCRRGGARPAVRSRRRWTARCRPTWSPSSASPGLDGVIHHGGYCVHHGGNDLRPEPAHRRAGARPARRPGPLARRPGRQVRRQPLDDLARSSGGEQPHRGGPGEARRGAGRDAGLAVRYAGRGPGAQRPGGAA